MLSTKYDDGSIQSIVAHASQFLEHNLRDILTPAQYSKVQEQIQRYGRNRKGYFGDLVEEYLFGIQNNNHARADFEKVGLELKTTPVKKHATKQYIAKERLVFSMINYMDIINETWEQSTFLQKNSTLLLMFYGYEKELSLLDYRFKSICLVNLLSDVSKADLVQIQADWQIIVNKIKAGEAHLLSEADTAYLSASTKASKATNTRSQPKSDVPAKPRAFSFKPSYLNFIIQKSLGIKPLGSSLFESDREPLTLEQNIHKRFEPYLGLTNIAIEKSLGVVYEKRPKNHQRLLLTKLFGSDTKQIQELIKANITLKVIALEPNKKLKESISFPVFNYQSLVHQTWETSDFYAQLTTKRFLFVVFEKTQTKDETCLKKVQFWNFPASDLSKAQWVWEETKRRIQEKQAHNLPKIRENTVAHVRPHARNAQDTLPTHYGTNEVKKCFWLNAKYIEKELL